MEVGTQEWSGRGVMGNGSPLIIEFWATTPKLLSATYMVKNAYQVLTGVRAGKSGVKKCLQLFLCEARQKTGARLRTVLNYTVSQIPHNGTREGWRCARLFLMTRESKMIHGLITFVLCIVICILKLPIYLCAFPAAFYVGREFAQAEYRYIKTFCGGKRENFNTIKVFSIDAWTLKGILDWTIPSFVAILFIIVKIMFF